MTNTSVRTATLEIAYRECGPSDGPAVILLHGFPDDVHAYDGVAPSLAADGCRVLMPWLRGYGPTRFLDAATPRSGQQAALGADLRDFMDALGIPQATLAGYDWGGRAACVVAALWPERVRGLVSITGYNIQNIAARGQPASAAAEYRYWYQWYFHTERGRAGLTQNRHDICRLLWKLWSPNWQFDDATYRRTGASFDNPGFRRRGDPVLSSSLWVRAGRSGARADRAASGRAAEDRGPHHRAARRGGWRRSGRAIRTAMRDISPRRYERRVVPVAGHFLPNEAPQAVVQAIRDLLR